MNDLQKMLTKYQCCKVREEKNLAEQVVTLSLQMIFNTEGSEPEQDEKKAIAENLIQYWKTKDVHSGKLTCLNNELKRQLFNSKSERSDYAKSPFKPAYIKRIDIIDDIYQAVIREIDTISHPSLQMRLEYAVFFPDYRICYLFQRTCRCLCLPSYNLQRSA